jgi:hypothetical protein
MLTFTSYIFGNNIHEKNHIYSEFNFSEKNKKKKVFVHTDKVRNLCPCLNYGNRLFYGKIEIKGTVLRSKSGIIG